MKHDERLLIRYVYRELSGHERTEVERHLAGCKMCREHLAVLRAVGNSLDKWNERIPSPGLHVKVWAHLEKQRRAAGWQSSRSPVVIWMVGMGAAAAVLALVVRVMQPVPIRTRAATPSVVGYVRAGGPQDTVVVMRGAAGQMMVVWLVQKDDRAAVHEQRSGI